MNEETTNVTDNKEHSENEGKSQIGKKLFPIIIAVAVILIALAVGFGIYNTPANRLQRQLDLGNKYLEEQQYEQAAIAFEEAIVIDDRCMEAYTGGIEAYLGAGNVDGAQDFYDRTLTMLSGLDTDFADANMEAIVEIYLAVGDVYAGDTEKITQVLEDGYTFTGEDSRIKDKLIENYLQIGKEDTQNGSYEDALTVYDRLLELDSANTETINGLCDCLNKYIDILMEAGKYDEIRALAEKYGDIAANVDFKDILDQIAEIQRIEAENRAFMQKVFDLMAAEDYEEGMCEVDGSEEAGAFVERMEGDLYVYIPDSNDSLNGIGAGVYQFSEGGYYFYYGDYVDGERKGTGTEFVESATGYTVFSGTWDKDAPNGEGTEIAVGHISGDGTAYYNLVSCGMLIDGLWDGQVRAILTDSRNGAEFDLSFDAVNGMPEDKTEEYLSEIWWADGLEEGQYIYAFYYNPRVDYDWHSYLEEGGRLGITGFIE